eukprot:TRINITY_DN17758_c0_g1_i1.p1 TRINITY_DN17758_c0_g1~~TRINITY_DN17758_c0_g1_i1.p1  ORF type:complete len:489 (+),score=79.48 TRINITY_DN17758_c0_g1_i1:60-1469(+)
MNWLQEMSSHLTPYVNNKEMSDVVFLVGSEEDGPLERVHAHKFILGARSCAFRAMLFGSMREGKESVVRIPNIRPKVFVALMQFIYTATPEDNLNAEFAMELMRAASQYHLDSLTAFCKKQIQSKITDQNVCQLLQMASNFNHSDLYEQCVDRILKHAPIAFHSPSFQELSEENVILLIKNDLLELNELQVFQAIVKWAKAAIHEDEEDNSSGRDHNLLKEKLANIFPLIRFPLMKGTELSEEVEPLGLVPESYLLEAYRYHSTHKGDPSCIRFSERGPVRITRRKFVYHKDFDDNGILYWIGSEGRQKLWTNPCDAGKVRVSSSHFWEGSPISAVVGRSCTESYISDKKRPRIWVMIDLGENNKTSVTHYSLRHGLNREDYYLRNWELQGSNDGFEWTVLSKHENDTTLSSSFSSHTWEVNYGREKSFRYFRLFTTGADSKGCFTFVVCGFELYGTLTTKVKRNISHC